LVLKCVECGKEAEYVSVNSYCKRHYKKAVEARERIRKRREELDRAFEKRYKERKAKIEAMGYSFVGMLGGALVGIIISGHPLAIFAGGILGTVLTYEFVIWTWRRTQ